ncbi:alpha/beta fold hydrolase [Hyalangium versicolor]|uniref:alpha/beta fold hydrolase n=1 Tax=Hyalangium versicolor TaxID=2861190 RepID=UPI001CCC9009|nr:alpha/beta hydrolase [Hyalangium versicolor]
MLRAFVAALAVASLMFAGCSDEEAPSNEQPRSTEPVDQWFTASDGVKLHYLEIAGEGTPVILLHGYMGTASGAWVAPGFSKVLAERHRVIMLDQRGHGESDKPHEASAYGERMVTDVIELMDGLKISKAHIGGYSMGGSMVRVLMERVPERFITASIGGAGVEELDEGLKAEAEARDPKGTDPEEAELLKLIEESQANMPEPDLVALGAVGQAWGTWWPQPIDLTAIGFPVQAVNGEFDNPYSRTTRMTRELRQFENVIVPGRTHLTTIIDPLYLNSLVTFIDTHEPQ